MNFQYRHSVSKTDGRLSAMSPIQLTSKNKPTGIRGFTLIEVMIAMAIFAIGILAVCTMQMRSISQNSSARIQTEATTLAVGWMERLLLLPYEDVSLNEGDHPTVGDPPVSSSNYIIIWTVEEDPTNLGLPIKQIDIAVTHPNRNANTVRLSSIKGQGQAAGTGP